MSRRFMTSSFREAMCPSCGPLPRRGQEGGCPRPRRGPQPPQPGVSGGQAGLQRWCWTKPSLQGGVGACWGLFHGNLAPSPSTLGVQGLPQGSIAGPPAWLIEKSPRCPLGEGACRLPSAGSQPTLCGNSLSSGLQVDSSSLHPSSTLHAATKRPV